MSGATLDLLSVKPGTRVSVKGGGVAEVVENPRDGMWLFCRYIEHPTDPTKVDGEEHAVFAHDIVALLVP